jgi:hypothetical protein
MPQLSAAHWLILERRARLLQRELPLSIAVERRDKSGVLGIVLRGIEIRKL